MSTSTDDVQTSEERHEGNQRLRERQLQQGLAAMHNSILGVVVDMDRLAAAERDELWQLGEKVLGCLVGSSLAALLRTTARAACRSRDPRSRCRR